MNLKSYLFFFLLSTFFLSSCGEDKGKDIPDVSNISSDVIIKRFEKDLFNLDTTTINASLAVLEKKYPEFSSIFFNQILGSKDARIAPQGHEEYVKGFINFPSIRHLSDTINIVFGDMIDLEVEFNQTFQFYQYYFPNRKVPDITTFISEYSLAGFIYSENSLAIGLDFFLGESYPYQYHNPGNPNFSRYLTRSFNKDHLVLKTLTPMIEDEEFLGFPSGNRLLDIMIHNGKKRYILSQLLPYVPDSTIMEYSQKQIDWVEDNEFEMWAHLAKEDLFYATDGGKIRKLIEHSPHSPGMPPEAPGRTANWLGWQIVKEYMRRHSDTSLEDLIALKSAQQIMDESKYKPNR